MDDGAGRSQSRIPRLETVRARPFSRTYCLVSSGCCAAW
jgi:hypothetical protein